MSTTLPEDSPLLQIARVAHQGDAKTLRQLLADGADPNGYWTAEMALARHDEMNSEIGNLDIPFADDFSEELDAIDREERERVARAPASFDLPLFEAAESGSLECIEALLEAGANLRALDNSERTAMFYARDAETIRFLLDRGLDLSAQDQFGWTPLTDAVHDGIESLPRIRALIEAGADVNATHDRGFTVFMSAAGSMERHVAILRTLVDAGADPHAVSELGFNALHAAVDVSGEANEISSIDAVLHYLNELQLEIEAKNSRGQTPLALAVMEGTADEVAKLLELGADPNVSARGFVCGDDDEDVACDTVETPLLMLAITNGVDSAKKVESLLMAGAKTDVRDADGHSPLEIAEQTLQELSEDEPDEFTEEWIEDAKRCIELLSL